MRSGLNRNAPPRVVADTNVIVSALIAPQGNEYQVLRLAIQGKIELYLSPFIVQEAERVFRGKLGWTLSRWEQSLSFLQGLATMVEPNERVEIVTRKDSDNRILECCLAIQADYLITGDRQDLLPIGQFESTTIVNAAAFLAVFRPPLS